jgi:hypothetical protein
MAGSGRSGVIILSAIAVMLLVTPAIAWNLHSPNIPNTGFHIGLDGGWGYFNLDDLNRISNVFIGRKTNNGLNLSIDGSYFLSRKFALAVGLNYISSSVRGDFRSLYPSDNNMVLYTYSQNIKAYAPYLGIRYYFPLAHVDYFLSADQILGFGKVHTKYLRSDVILNSDRNYTGIGIGISGSGGLHKSFDRNFGLNIEVGYRYLVTGDLLDSNDQPLAASQGSNRNAILDLSGPFATVGISFKLF